MAPAVRIIGTDGEEIRSLDDWLAHAPPAKGSDQWVDCFSAKEQAKCWLRHGDPAVPAELLYEVRAAGSGDVDRWTAYPERYTEFDQYSRDAAGTRHHDMLVLLGDPRTPEAVLAIEAKAGESFGGAVSNHVKTPPQGVTSVSLTPPWKTRGALQAEKALERARRVHAERLTRAAARCNLLSRALFGRPVCDEQRCVVTDDVLGQHAYQLWTAALGTAVEAQGRGVPDAVLLVHQFASGPDPCLPGDQRAWATTLRTEAAKIAAFKSALGPLPSSTFETQHVKAGTRLHVLTAVSVMEAPSG